MLQLIVKHVLFVTLIGYNLVPTLNELVTTRAHLVHHVRLALADRRVVMDIRMADNDALLGRGTVQVRRVLSRDVKVGSIVIHLDRLCQMYLVRRRQLVLLEALRRGD